MFIYVLYKDPPELSNRRSSVELLDTSVEKSLLVNPDCPVRIMLEYIRKKCRLGNFTQFDLCDESGVLKGLFSLNTYAYATEQFEHKKEPDKTYTVFPQLNQENKLYFDLRVKVKKTMVSGDPVNSTGHLAKKSLVTSPELVKVSPVKTTSTGTGKASGKKK